jgi:hypothetical protein
MIGTKRCLAGVLFFLLKVSTSGAQELTVQAFRDEDVDLRKYETYFWASHADSNEGGSYFLNDLVLKADIRDAVHSAMQARGYSMEETSPDLLVNFRLFERGAVLKGAQGYGSNYWKKEEISSIDNSIDEINVKAGTLIISLLDRSSGKLIWQGFASGLIGEKDFMKDEGKIREAVNLIFEEYGYRVDEYTKR